MLTVPRSGDESSARVMQAFFYPDTVTPEDEKPLTRVAFFTKVASLFESKIPHRLTGGRHETLQMFSAPQMVIHFAREAINGLDSAGDAAAAAGGCGSQRPRWRRW